MKLFFTYLLIFTSSLIYSQNKLSKLLKKHNSEEVPYTKVEDISTDLEVVFLDAREPIEFEVSHLKNAICVGYDQFDLNKVENQIPNKNQKIVVYCSLGIRSEVVAKKLIEAGYTNVNNLYGGIFEWKNNGLEVYNMQRIATDSVHAFSKEWSKWLKKGTKVYPETNK